MNVLVIGGVAAGTKVAAKLKRELGDACKVTLIEKGKNISYSGCGIPYFIGGVIQSYEQLIVNTPEEYSKITGVEVLSEVEALELNRDGKIVKANNLKTGSNVLLSYDKLVIAVGASAVRPPVEGNNLPGTFLIRTPDDALSLREAVKAGMKRAIVLGGGFIGLEIAENLKSQGINTVVLDMASHILPGFDKDFAEYAESCMEESGIPVFTGERLMAIEGNGKVELIRTETRKMKADAVIMAAGIRPNTKFLADSGLKMSKSGALIVDETMNTNDPDIYAIGDCVMIKNRITKEHVWNPIGSVASITGRICAEVMSGEKILYPGVLGTALVKLAGANAAKTGLTSTDAAKLGIDFVSSTITVDDKVNYYPDADFFTIRLVADKNSHKLLGVQVVGKGAVDKIVDIGVTAISLGATLESLECLDLSYAPPFSTAIHPFVHAVNILKNKIEGKLNGVSLEEFRQLPDNTLYLDVMKSATINGYRSMPVVTINSELEEIEKGHPIALVCEKGKQGYLAQNRLKRYGYTNTRVLEGGTKFNNINKK